MGGQIRIGDWGNSIMACGVGMYCRWALDFLVLCEKVS